MKIARFQVARKSGSPIFARRRRLPISLRERVADAGATPICWSTGVASASEEIGECTAKIGKLKTESVFQKSSRPAAPSGERKARFGAHQARADSGGPCWHGRAPGPMHG